MDLAVSVHLQTKQGQVLQKAGKFNVTACLLCFLKEYLGLCCIRAVSLTPLNAPDQELYSQADSAEKFAVRSWVWQNEERIFVLFAVILKKCLVDPAKMF